MLKSLLAYKLDDEHAPIILVYMLRYYGVIKSFVSVIFTYADINKVN